MRRRRLATGTRRRRGRNRVVSFHLGSHGRYRFQRSRGGRDRVHAGANGRGRWAHRNRRRGLADDATNGRFGVQRRVRGDPAQLTAETAVTVPILLTSPGPRPASRQRRGIRRVRSFAAAARNCLGQGGVDFGKRRTGLGRRHHRRRTARAGPLDFPDRARPLVTALSFQVSSRGHAE